jgi:hypothetical protein
MRDVSACEIVGEHEGELFLVNVISYHQVKTEKEI